MRGKYHRWTAAEEVELLQDINTQGISVAVTNFSAKYKIDNKAVRNKANRLHKGDFTKHYSKSIEKAAIDADLSTKHIKTKKTDKITIMVGKEYMNKLKVEFSEGKLTISYPKEDQLDIKFL